MNDWATVILALAQLAIITMFIVSEARARKLDPLAPFWTIWICQAITYGIRPIMLCYDQPRFGAFWPIVAFDAYGFHFASICGLASTVLLLAGYEITRRGKFRPLALAESAAPLATLVASTGGLVLAAIALASKVSRSRVSFDPSSLLMGQSRAEIGQQEFGYGYETIAYEVVPMYVAAVAAAYLPQKPPRLAIPILFTIISVLILSPTGGRSFVMLSLATLVYIWHYHVRRINIRWAVVFAGFFFVVASVMGNLRSGVPGRGVVDAVGRTTMAFDGFEALVALSRRFSLDDVLWGRSYFESLFYTYIPRAIWTHKPLMYGALLCEEYIYPELANSYGNIGTYPPGYVGEALVNFWYVGLVVVPFLLGAALAFVESAVNVNRHIVLPTIVAAIFVGDAIATTRSLGDNMIEIFSMALLFGALRVMVPLRIHGVARLERGS